MTVAPFVPSDCDLRDAEYMPLDVSRLLDSAVFGLEDPEAFRAAVASWAKSWHQVPAASLPDDDGQLCRLLGYGRDVAGWRKLRESGALQGWVKASDDRLYHPVVAAKALSLWLARLLSRKAGAVGNAKRHGYAYDTASDDAAILETARMLDELDPSANALVKQRAALAKVARSDNPQEQSPGSPPEDKNHAFDPGPDRPPTGLPSPPDPDPTGGIVGSRSQAKVKVKVKVLPSEEEELESNFPGTERLPPQACSAPAREDLAPVDPGPTAEWVDVAPRTPSPGRAKPRGNPNFDAWYAAYPRRVAPDEALKAYQRIVRDGRATPAELLAGAERYALAQAGQDPKFTKHPASWLNAGSWKDEPPPAFRGDQHGRSHRHSSGHDGLMAAFAHRFGGPIGAADRRVAALARAGGVFDVDEGMVEQSDHSRAQAGDDETGTSSAPLQLTYTRRSP